MNENVIQSFERANFYTRFWAFFSDTIVLGVPLRLIHLIIKTFTVNFSILNTVLYYYDIFVPLLVYFWYFTYYAYKNNGQTLGKKWYKIRIAKLDGTHPSLAHFIFRFFVKDGVILIISNFYRIAFIRIIWVGTYLLALTKERRALHDIISKTQVIIESGVNRQSPDVTENNQDD